MAGCTGIALILGLLHLQRRSLWQDEGFTWSTVDRGFPALLSVMIRHEGYSMLHTLVEWPANRISSTLTGVRLPSLPPDPWRQFKTGEQKVIDFDERTIARADPHRYPRLWLIAFRVKKDLKPRFTALQRSYHVVSRRTYQGGIEVLFLQPRNP